MGKIVAVASLDLAAGFRLAGVDECFEVKNLEEAEKVFEKLAERTDITVLIVPQSLSKKLRDTAERLWGKSLYPRIVEIPDKRLKEPFEYRSLAEILRSALGIDIFKT
ncbi:hypothetical protein DRO57_03230 [Candidatus Bathyarchaeota archaeon]|nr:MAG: hypothetical protein DRO57_03230 [Candidatus Bathyarchaeota archaeon]